MCVYVMGGNINRGIYIIYIYHEKMKHTSTYMHIHIIYMCHLEIQICVHRSKLYIIRSKAENSNV